MAQIGSIRFGRISMAQSAKTLLVRIVNVNLATDASCGTDYPENGRQPQKNLTSASNI